MVNKCCVPRCSSGYSSVKNPRKKISFFQFPKGADERHKWLRAIRRTDYVPTDYSKVCSLHFVDTDFETDRKDSNRWRSGGRLKKKILKIDAVPSIFPHFPSYLQGRATSRRSERATSTSRLDSENLDLLSSIAAFEEDDVITSLDDLKSKFRASTSTSNFVLIENICNDSLVFAEFADDLPPKVVKSVVVSQELSFVAYEGNNTLPDHVYKSGMKFSSSIVRFSDFLNLLAYVHNHVMESAPLVEAEKLLTSHAENADISSITVQKLFFICEQLQFLINPKKCFSANLLTLGILWKAHSTSCYKAILSEGVLTLPSQRTQRRQ